LTLRFPARFSLLFSDFTIHWVSWQSYRCRHSYIDITILG
jgi:hypothetical protein